MISQNVKKKIQKYAELRGVTDRRLSAELLQQTYEQADPKVKAVFREEMDVYIRAVKSGRLKPGEPLVMTELRTP